MKRLLWTLLVTAVSAAAAASAAALLDRLWSRVAKSPPPTVPAWARLLVGKRLRRAVEQRVYAELP